jgi:hypothetical protein
MNMPPRWGFSSCGVRGYNDVAPSELKNDSSAAASTAAFIQQQCILSRSREGINFSHVGETHR